MEAGVVAVIGIGGVGSAIARELWFSGACSEILLHNRTGDRAAELAEELTACGQVGPPRGGAPVVRAVERLEGVASADAVFVCVKSTYRVRVAAEAAADARMAGLRDVPLVGSLARRLGDVRGVVLMVTNPVEVMCRVWSLRSGVFGGVLGLGLSLDAARAGAALRRSMPGLDHSAAVHPRSGLVAIGGHATGPRLAVEASRLGSMPLATALAASGVDAGSVMERCRASVMSRVARFGRTTLEPARVFRHDVRALLAGEAVNAAWSGCGQSMGLGEVPVGGLVRLVDGELACEPVAMTEADRAAQGAAGRAVEAALERSAVSH